MIGAVERTQVATAQSAAISTRIAAPQAVAPAFAPDQARLSPVGQTRRTIEQANLLAQSTLDGNLANVTVLDDPARRTVIFAGKGKFEALWTRDAMYTALGALATGRTVAVRGTLESLLSTQNAEGLLPRRIGAGSVGINGILDALGIKRKQATHLDHVDHNSDGFWTGTVGVISPDSNMLTIQLAAAYVKQTNDAAFLDANFAKLAKAMAWVRAQVQEDGFVHQIGFSDWKDCVNRGKITMYNQVLYYQALQGMAELQERRGQARQAAGYRDEAAALAGRMRAFFWDEQKGIFKDSEEFSGYSPDGNLMAIAAGIATPAETNRIFAYTDGLLQRRPMLPATEDDYPADRVVGIMRVAGMQHYHDSQYWPWQEGMYAIAATRAGDKPRAEAALARAAELAVRDRGFYEVYEGTQPRIVKRLFYKSEPNFSWSSGLFLRAYQELYGA